MESKQGLIEILNKISDKGLGSFLAVLKIFGKQDDLISFPTEGYTLALDFPVRKGLFEFLDELDKVVLAYGGRLYVERCPHEILLYYNQDIKQLPKFMEIVRKYNPNSKIRSEQSNRLSLNQN
ncbi:MAG: hypothetical protein WDN26_00220 [Chitinophagaceae bacterium]